MRASVLPLSDGGESSSHCSNHSSSHNYSRHSLSHGPSSHSQNTDKVRTISRLIVLLFIIPVVGGTLTYYSFAPHSLWPLELIGIAVLLADIALIVEKLSSHPYWYAAIAGFVWAMTLYIPLFQWIKTFVENLPWIILCLVLSLFSVLVTIPIAHFIRLWGVICLKSALAAALWWTVVEVARAHFPFGGFPWGSPAYAQTTGPLMSAALWGSTAGTNFLIVVWSYTLFVLVWAVLCEVSYRREHHRIGEGLPSTRHFTSFHLRYACITCCALVLMGTIGTAGSFTYDQYERAHAESLGERRIAFIQGNVSTSGLSFNTVRMEVLHNHVQATFKLADEVKRGLQPQPDIVVWPENSADIDPIGNPDANFLITRAAQAIHAPILVGSVLGRESHSPQLNAILLWTGKGYQGIRHVKRHIQPFGEYLPLRRLVEKISPYAMWAGNFQPGNDDGVIPVDGTRAGVATCFEIIFDDSGRQAVHHAANWLAVPTNNATFGFSNETYQQLAISQFRARELHRWVVVASTSGASAFISPDGTIWDETPLYEQHYAVRSISLYGIRTAATYLQPWLDRIFCTLGILVCIGSIISWKKRKIPL